MKATIAKAVSKIINVSAGDIESLIEIPKETERGDYAFPCFSLAKNLKKNPVIIAQEISSKIKTGKEIERVEAVGPYINFFVNRSIFANETLSIASKKTFGRGKEKGTIVMDYSHPNVAKHFGVHNLRSTLIGHAIYNLLVFSGKKVISVNHLGDWGTQFGKLIVAYKLYGNKKSLKDIASLNALYIRFHDEAEKNPTLEDQAREEFKKLEDGNKDNVKLWKSFLDISLKEFMKTYRLLDITFDQIKGESFYRSEVKKILERLNKKGILEESEGAQVVKFDDLPPAIIAKSDEASTYATRDVAAVFERLKENPEKILYIVDVRQSLHFEQVFRVAEKLGVDKNKLVHVKFGLMKFPDMEMSTRKGKVVLFEYLLEKATAELVKIIQEKNPDLKNKEKIAQQLALASIVFNDVQNNRIHDVVFNWEHALNFEGKAAPYILYTYVRALSILKKSKVKLTTVADSISNSEFSLIKKIAEFPDTARRAAESYEPHIIAEYVYQLSQGFNEFYHADKVVGSETEGFRVALVSAFSQTLKNALSLLGIPVLEQM